MIPRQPTLQQVLQRLTSGLEVARASTDAEPVSWELRCTSEQARANLQRLKLGRHGNDPRVVVTRCSVQQRRWTTGWWHSERRDTRPDQQSKRRHCSCAVCSKQKLFCSHRLNRWHRCLESVKVRARVPVQHVQVRQGLGVGLGLCKCDTTLSQVLQRYVE